MLDHSWPGNVRELENVIERAVILCPGQDLLLGPETLPASSVNVIGGKTVPPDLPDSPVPALTLEQAERQHIITMLKTTQWRIDGLQGAAQLLGLPASTLRSRMKKLGIQRSIVEAS